MAVSWIRIAVFYLLALCSSFPLLGLRARWFYEADLPFEFHTGKAVLIALGPLLGGLLLRRFLPGGAKSSLSGGQWWRSGLMILLPVLGFTLLGVSYEGGQNAHWVGFWLSTILILYALGEEFGWRGFLEEELSAWPAWAKYGSIGILWYLWHWTFLHADRFLPELVFCVILIGASWGIGQIKRGTQSLLACTAFHLIGNVFFRYQLIVEGVPAQARYLLLAGCLAIWIGLLVKWPKPESKQVEANNLKIN